MQPKSEKMENQMINLLYEQPSLKKYGTMKEFTLGSSGSGGDGMGSDTNPNSNQFGVVPRNGNKIDTAVNANFVD